MYLPHKGKQNVIHVCSTFQGIERSPEQFAVDTFVYSRLKNQFLGYCGTVRTVIGLS